MKYSSNQTPNTTPPHGSDPAQPRTHATHAPSARYTGAHTHLSYFIHSVCFSTERNSHESHVFSPTLRNCAAMTKIAYTNLLSGKRRRSTQQEGKGRELRTCGRLLPWNTPAKRGRGKEVDKRCACYKLGLPGVAVCRPPSWFCFWLEWKRVPLPGGLFRDDDDAVASLAAMISQRVRWQLLHQSGTNQERRERYLARVTLASFALVERLKVRHNCVWRFGGFLVSSSLVVVAENVYLECLLPDIVWYLF